MRFLNHTVAALLLVSMPAAGFADRLDELYEELQRPDQDEWQRIERQIVSEWSRSGSASADLLLQRGRDALQRGEVAEAVEHLTALTDHAPEFAEGWNARAGAFFQQGHYGLAMDDIGRALALNPMHFSAMTGLATILEEVDQPLRALEVYRAAHAIHPHDPTLSEAIERLERDVAGESL